MSPAPLPLPEPAADLDLEELISSLSSYSGSASPEQRRGSTPPFPSSTSPLAFTEASSPSSHSQSSSASAHGGKDADQSLDLLFTDGAETFGDVESFFADALAVKPAPPSKSVELAVGEADQTVFCMSMGSQQQQGPPRDALADLISGFPHALAPAMASHEYTVHQQQELHAVQTTPSQEPFTTVSMESLMLSSSGYGMLDGASSSHFSSTSTLSSVSPSEFTPTRSASVAPAPAPVAGRKRPSSELIPLDAPVQPRKYTTVGMVRKSSADGAVDAVDGSSSSSSSTAPAPIPVQLPLPPRKRGRKPAAKSAEEAEQRKVESKLAKRMSNTIAARRSRHRKAEELQELHDRIAELESEAQMWKSKYMQAVMLDEQQIG